MAKEKFDPYKIITDKIINFLESNEKLQFRDLWSKTSSLAYKNGSSGKSYNGVNILILGIRSYEEEWQSPLFFTFRQVNDISKQYPKEACNIIKGSKSEQICYWTSYTKQVETDSGEIEEHRIPILRLYRVFNRDQIEATGKAANQLDKYTKKKYEYNNERDEDIEVFLTNLGSEVNCDANKAYYTPTTDRISIPPIKKFISSDSYYSVRFHEEIHRTGHESRCNRQLKNRFGSEEYAVEELIAEIGATYLCFEFEINQSEREFKDNTSYIANWLQVLKDDKYAVFTCAKHARLAVEWMKEQQDNA